MTIRSSRYVSYFLLFLSVCFIVLGLIYGDFGDVLTKSSHICLECIGVG